MVVRQCVICGKEFDTKNRSNNAITCSVECSKKRKKEIDRQWRYDNREYRSKYRKIYYQQNCESIKQKSRKYYYNNREYILECQEKYRQNHRQQKRQYDKQWYQDNREYKLEYHARYRDQHPEKYDKDKREKETPGLKEAKKIARQNANYQCELTGWKGPNNVHHLNGYVFFPDQRADLNNLIVLHTDIHKHFHRMYGKNGDNTIDQFDEFVCNFFPLQVDNFRMNKYKYLPEHTYNT